MAQAEDAVVVAAPGRIAVRSALIFQTARRICEAGIACLERDGSSSIVVDCSGVTKADSAGLAVLIEWRRWALMRDQHVRFVNLPGQISAIAHLSEVADVLADQTA